MPDLHTRVGRSGEKGDDLPSSRDDLPSFPPDLPNSRVRPAQTGWYKPEENQKEEPERTISPDGEAGESSFSSPSPAKQKQVEQARKRQRSEQLLALEEEFSDWAKEAAKDEGNPKAAEYVADYVAQLSEVAAGANGGAAA